MSDERTTLLKAAVKQCFAAKEPVSVANVRKHTPGDFWIDFDTGKELDDVEIFRQIQSTYSPAPKSTPMIADRPDGQGKLAEPFPNWLPPSDHVAEPVTTEIGDAKPVEIQEENPVEIDQAKAAPAPIESTPSHAATGPGQQSAQERLDRARTVESDLIGARPALIQAQRAAQAAVNLAKEALAAVDPNRMTPAELSADYRKSSQAARAERVAREGSGRQRIAFVDLQRKYSSGGSADDYARKLARTGNKRGAFSSAEAVGSGFINTDSRRGAVPAPVAPPRKTIPALARK